MADAVVLKTKKLFANKLLSRRQMLLEVHHGNKPTPTRKEIRDKVAALYKVKDTQTIVVFGLTTKFGGGVTEGFALIYDSLEVLKKIEPAFRQRKNGFDAPNAKAGTTRKQRKEKKNKRKITVGTARRAAKQAAKKKQ